MPEKSIHDRLVDLLDEQLGINSAQLTPQARFIEDLGADSLDTVELIMALIVQLHDLGITDPEVVRDFRSASFDAARECWQDYWGDNRAFN